MDPDCLSMAVEEFQLLQKQGQRLKKAGRYEHDLQEQLFRVSCRQMLVSSDIQVVQDPSLTKVRGKSE